MANLRTSGFRLWIANDATDFALMTAHRTTLPACNVAWRDDGQQLLVAQAAPNCSLSLGLGPLVRVEMSNSRINKNLGPVANDPAFQPVSVGG